MATVETAADILAAVRELAPSIAARGDEIEAARRIPADLNDQLREAGLYRMLVPRSHGGMQVGLLDVLEIVETLSVADGSVGWTATIGLQSPELLALLPRETFDAVYADGPDVTVGGAFGPQGQAEVVDGGYRVSGKWAFASGSDNWDLLFGNCVLVENGEPKPGVAPGQPATRAMLFQPGEAEVLDTWYTLGLRGSGSHHFAVADVFVPEERTFDIFFGAPSVAGIYRYPIIEFAQHIGSILIGIARGALEELVESATTRQRFSSRTTVAQTPVAQYQVGRCETALRAARELLYAESRKLVAGEAAEDFVGQMVPSWANNAWTAQLCVEIVETCYRIHGASSVYDGAPLQRRLRDIYTICQHAATNEASLTRAGAALFGQDVGPFFG
jgi:alkylation response protein AidB-like acyl-CoA dehydrogenase